MAWTPFPPLLMCGIAFGRVNPLPIQQLAAQIQYSHFGIAPLVICHQVFQQVAFVL
jgi:hypothetical protein